jgi:membrane AbrB-like protein
MPAGTGFTTLLTLALGTLGGVLLTVLGLPASWLAGSMLAVAAAALAAVPVAVPGSLRTLAFITVGVSMGTAVTPETLRQITQWPLSLALLGLSVIATIRAITWHLERWHRWDHATARFTAVPGALTAVLIMAAASNADVPRVAFAQTVRLLVLVALMPVVLALFGDDGAAAPVPAQAIAAPADLLVLALAGGAMALLATRLRVPAGALLGAMLASAALHGSGLVSGLLPQPLLVASFIVTGCVIGERFRATRFAVIGAAARAAGESVTLAIILALGFAYAGHLVLGRPVGQLFLAFAPGGIEAMTIMASLLNLDPTFVAGHHLVRFLALSFLGPLWMPRRTDQR